MDAVVKSLLERPQPQPSTVLPVRPTREEAEAAVRVLLRWTGDDPSREGLRDTPKRVAKAFEEFFSGYKKTQRACSLASSRKSMAMTMWFSSATSRFRRTASITWCPFFGMAHVAYYPSEIGVVGLSKLARLVDVFAKRLQTQEALTAQIVERDRSRICARAAVP